MRARNKYAMVGAIWCSFETVRVRGEESTPGRGIWVVARSI